MALNFVEIENDVALVDTRVYCREVIQVEHSDWMSNVLAKYQPIIQKHFGLLRFRNGEVLTLSGTKYERYAFLTEAQCNFALTLSRNTPEVVINKANLIQDFESAKQIIRESLERSLSSNSEILLQAQAEIAELKARLQQSQQNHLDFSYSARLLWKVSGIVNFSQVKNAIKHEK